ncbi:MAG TPA: acetolactate synthase [Candidatus Dormibacteraeota bacterium]|jgi:acetolactate synthase-1/2/3 large subunit
MEGHGGHVAAEVLRRRGVDTVFTLSGGHLFPIYDGLVERGIRLVDTRQEQTAAFAAEGWSKLTRRLGVAMVTAGPGVTNAMSAIAGAHLAGSPLMVLGGRAPEARWGSGSLQELDHLPLVASICRRAATATSPATLAAEVEATAAAALTAHRGPAFLDVPLDVLLSTTDPALPEPVVAERPAPDPDAVARVADLLLAAERPVLIAGSDLYWDGGEAALVRCAEALGLPVFTSGLARGTIPGDHPLALARCRGRALAEADLVVAAGVPLDFRLRFGELGAARVVHLCDSPGQVARHVTPAASAAGDLGAILDLVVAAAERRGARPCRTGWLGRLGDEEAALRARETAELEAEASPIRPGRIYGELRRRLDRDAVVIGDGGDFVSYAGRLLDTFQPGCFLDPGPYGCLGTGAGYAIAARLAHPDRQVVLLLGDGAAGFSLLDVDTLVRFNLPVVVIVGNNNGWGLERSAMQQWFGYHVAAELRPGTRYDEVVHALGGHGELVTESACIGPAIDRAFAAGVPALVNVLTDPDDVYPRRTALG